MGEKMKTKRNIFIAFILNLLFSVFELIGGIITGSVAIASDAIHDFGDATSIGASYFLERLSDKKPNEKYTYGYARFSVLGGLLTTLILLISSAIIIYNATLRIITPRAIDYNGMLIFAIIGLFVNLVATYYTHGGKSINQKAVNLHMLEDVFGWLVVLVGAIVIKFTNLYVVDPILSIAVAVLVIVNCIKNLKQIIEIISIKCPKEIDVDHLAQHLKEIDGVKDVHHIHLWTLDGEIHCATLHVVATEIDSRIKNDVREALKEHGVLHSTIEMETELEECKQKTCDIKKQVYGECCHHHHHSHNHHHHH